MIPKIIHYCWLSKDPVPSKFQGYMAGWREKLPDYEFRKWSLESFDIDSSAWAKEAFERKKYAFAADFIRLYALYHVGGIYLDMDIEVKKDFSPLLDSSLMIAYENFKETGIEAGVVGAEKGNIFIKSCLDYYNGKHFVEQDGTLAITPLPEIMHKCLQKAGYNGIIYPCNYFTAKSYETGEIYADETTYSIDHFAGEWKTKKQKKWRSFQMEVRNKYGIKWGERLLKFPFVRIYGALYMYGFGWTIKRIISKIKAFFL